MLSVILLYILRIIRMLTIYCDQGSDLWQQLNMAAEFKSDLQAGFCWLCVI